MTAPRYMGSCDWVQQTLGLDRLYCCYSCHEDVEYGFDLQEHFSADEAMYFTTCCGAGDSIDDDQVAEIWRRVEQTEKSR